MPLGDDVTADLRCAGEAGHVNRKGKPFAPARIARMFGLNALLNQMNVSRMVGCFLGRGALLEILRLPTLNKIFPEFGRRVERDGRSAPG